MIVIEMVSKKIIIVEIRISWQFYFIADVGKYVVKCVVKLIEEL